MSRQPRLNYFFIVVLNCHVMMLVTECRNVSIITIFPVPGACRRHLRSRRCPQRGGAALLCSAPRSSASRWALLTSSTAVCAALGCSALLGSSRALGAPSVWKRCTRSVQDAVVGGLMSARAGAALCCV